MVASLNLGLSFRNFLSPSQFFYFEIFRLRRISVLKKSNSIQFNSIQTNFFLPVSITQNGKRLTYEQTDNRLHILSDNLFSFPIFLTLNVSLNHKSIDLYYINDGIILTHLESTFTLNSFLSFEESSLKWTFSVFIIFRWSLTVLNNISVEQILHESENRTLSKFDRNSRMWSSLFGVAVGVRVGALMDLSGFIQGRVDVYVYGWDGQQEMKNWRIEELKKQFVCLIGRKNFWMFDIHFEDFNSLKFGNFGLV
jgi:hypothetical protein